MSLVGVVSQQVEWNVTTKGEWTRPQHNIFDEYASVLSQRETGPVATATDSHHTCAQLKIIGQNRVPMVFWSAEGRKGL